MTSRGHILALLLLNLAAHFVPFERSGHQPDDYFRIAFAKGLSLRHRAIDLESVDRPLNRALTLWFFSGEARAFETGWQAPLVYASSSALLAVVYLFLAELFRDRRPALLASSLYCVLPNKLELYGTRTYALYNAFLALAVLSGWLYLRFLRTRRPALLVGAVAAYAAAIGCNELGFLLPVALFVLIGSDALEARRSIRWFAIPAGLFVILRLMTMNAVIPGLMSRPIEWTSLATNVGFAVPSHYLGRYMARAIAYGVAGVAEMSWPWLVCALAVDVALCGWAYLRRPDATAWPQISSIRLLLAAAVLIAPACLHSVQGRHTALASILLCALVVSSVRRIGRAAQAGALAAMLLVSQGDGWHNVVAGRITRALFSSLVERSADLRAAQRVLVDCRSFADAITYTWGERERNVLHYYFGVPVLGSWGLEGMVALAGGGSRHVAACGSVPIDEVGVWVCREHFKPPGPERTLRVPREGTFLLRFVEVYPKGFDRSDGRP